MWSQLIAGSVLLIFIVGLSTVIGTLINYGSTKPITYIKHKPVKKVRHGWWS